MDGLVTTPVVQRVLEVVMAVALTERTGRHPRGRPEALKVAPVSVGRPPLTTRGSCVPAPPVAEVFWTGEERSPELWRMGPPDSTVAKVGTLVPARAEAHNSCWVLIGWECARGELPGDGEKSLRSDGGSSGLRPGGDEAPLGEGDLLNQRSTNGLPKSRALGNASPEGEFARVGDLWVGLCCLLR